MIKKMNHAINMIKEINHLTAPVQISADDDINNTPATNR